MARRRLSLLAFAIPAAAAIPAAQVLLGAGLVSRAAAVAHGTPVPAGQYRFAVKLTMTGVPRPDGSHYDSACSAALIAARWVITAGHCVHDVHRNPVSGPVPYRTTATLGVSDLSDPHPTVVDVVRAVQSPTNDIAVAELARPVRGIAPLELSPSAPKVGTVLRIAGWGSLGDSPAVPGSHLQTGQMKIAAVTVGQVGVVGYAPASNTSACLYDSGAPYFTESSYGRAQLVSVESDGPSCPHATQEITSRVDTVLPWIRATLRTATDDTGTDDTGTDDTGTVSSIVYRGSR